MEQPTTLCHSLYEKDFKVRVVENLPLDSGGNVDLVLKVETDDDGMHFIKGVDTNTKRDSPIPDIVNGYVLSKILAVLEPEHKDRFMTYVADFECNNFRYTVNKLLDGYTSLKMRVVRRTLFRPVQAADGHIDDLFHTLIVYGSYYGFSHNDAHLGNVLYSPGKGFCIIDYGRTYIQAARALYGSFETTLDVNKLYSSVVRDNLPRYDVSVYNLVARFMGTSSISIPLGFVNDIVGILLGLVANKQVVMDELIKASPYAVVVTMNDGKKTRDIFCNFTVHVNHDTVYNYFNSKTKMSPFSVAQYYLMCFMAFMLRHDEMRRNGSFIHADDTLLFDTRTVMNENPKRPILYGFQTWGFRAEFLHFMVACDLVYTDDNTDVLQWEARLKKLKGLFEDVRSNPWADLVQTKGERSGTREQHETSIRKRRRARVKDKMPAVGGGGMAFVREPDIWTIPTDGFPKKVEDIPKPWETEYWKAVLSGKHIVQTVGDGVLGTPDLYNPGINPDPEVELPRREGKEGGGREGGRSKRNTLVSLWCVGVMAACAMMAP